MLLEAIAALRGDTGGNAPSADVATPSGVPSVSPEDRAERRQITVMFSDLVGSTALSTRMDPEDLREVISAYQNSVAATVGRFGGFVAKYMGDGVLVYFGYPQAHEDDAERAVRAGLELVTAIGDLKTHAALRTRVGIATGLVVVGDLIGSGASQEQAVVGETPNLAARLQALAEPSAVVISSSTRRLTGGLFEYHDLGSVALKGFAENVQTWQVLGAGAAEGRFEALRATSTPLVGRDEEIDLLMRRWAQAKAGNGSVVLIAGEPGIGKSRIAQTVQQRLAGEPYTSMRYFCSPHHQDSALHPVIALLERAAGFRRDDTDEKRLDKLEATLAEGANDLSEIAPLLADLLAIQKGERYQPLNLSPLKKKEKTLAALISQIEGLAARQPVLVVFEDIHWIDPTTREALDLLIDRVPSLRVLVIVTYRPEFTPPWVGRPQVTLLTLNRLPPAQRAEMIMCMTAGKVLPREVANQIVNRTDGVPLFIEELTKAVVESGVLTDAGDHYTVEGPLPPLAIPTTLNASLLARLDRLAPTREVVQIGAALGRQFSHVLISAVAQMPQNEIDDALAQLVGAELIFRRGMPPDAEYTFKHALVQDAAYSTLLRGRRQQNHARIAMTLEDQFADIVAAQPALIAQHCAEASFDEKAIAYWLKAGHQSIARSAMAEAVTQLQKGLDLIATQPEGTARREQELDLRIALAPALIATKGYSATDVGETITQARVLAQQLNRSDYLVSLLYAQWGFHHTRAEHRLALSCGEQMEQIGQSQSDIVVILMGRLYQATVRYSLGEFVTARTLLEQCLALDDPAHRVALATLTAEDLYMMALSWLAVTLGALGYIDQGRARISEAFSQVQRLEKANSQAFSHCFALIFACGTERVAGSHLTAKKYADALLALSDKHGFLYLWTCGLSHWGWSLTGLGQPEEALVSLAKGLSTNRMMGAAYRRAEFLMTQADAHGKLGQIDVGLNLLAEAAAVIEATSERCIEVQLHILKGNLLNASGDKIGAEQSYLQALAVARQQNAKTSELRAATNLARLWCCQGRRDEARDLLAAVYGWFSEGFDAPVLKEAKDLLDELASA